MICKECGKEYQQWYKSTTELIGLPENNLCLDCNDIAWVAFECEERNKLAQNPVTIHIRGNLQA